MIKGKKRAIQNKNLNKEYLKQFMKIKNREIRSQIQQDRPIDRCSLTPRDDRTTTRRRCLEALLAFDDIRLPQKKKKEKRKCQRSDELDKLFGLVCQRQIFAWHAVSVDYSQHDLREGQGGEKDLVASVDTG